MQNKIFIAGPWLAIGPEPSRAQRILLSEVSSYYRAGEYSTRILLRCGRELDFEGDLIGGIDALFGVQYANDPIFVSAPDPRQDPAYYGYGH